MISRESKKLSFPGKVGQFFFTAVDLVIPDAMIPKIKAELALTPECGRN